MPLIARPEGDSFASFGSFYGHLSQMLDLSVNLTYELGFVAVGISPASDISAAQSEKVPQLNLSA